MSFTNQISGELLTLPLKKNCCRRALLFGLLMGASPAGEGGLLARYPSEEVSALAIDLLDRIFHASVACEKKVRAGREVWELRFAAKAIETFLSAVDGEAREPIHKTAGFRCASCQSEFMRGVFLGCATVTNPRKGYHMEISLPTEERCDVLRAFMELNLSRPGKIKRGSRFGLYYKSNGAISDLLYYIGGSGASFDVTNVWIERDIRNNENRATNCVARNISRSVDASKKQREAIERLYETRRIDALPEELRQTAALRLEYPDASLSELAMVHQPPISKSGLNRRLTRILEEAEAVTKTAL